MISPVKYKYVESLESTIPTGAFSSWFGISRVFFNLCKYHPEEDESPDCPEFLVRITPEGLSESYSYYMLLDEYNYLIDTGQLNQFTPKWFDQVIEEWRIL